MTEGERSELWNSLLDADMNVRYWTFVSGGYQQGDFLLKVFAALCSSAAVASWLLAEWPDLLKVASAAAAVANIVAAYFNIPRKIDNLSAIRGKWVELLARYERMWSNPPSDLDQQMSELSRRFIEASNLEAGFGRSALLVKKAQRAVRRARGLQ